MPLTHVVTVIYQNSMIGSTILKLMYGIEVQDYRDQNLATSEKAVETLADIADAGAYLGKIFRFYNSVFGIG